MVFAARDYFEAGREPPAGTTAPGEGPLFDYLCTRLFDSFGLPLGPARYLELMSPVVSDGETVLSRMGWAPHGRAWRMVNQEWPAVRADIDRRHPSPLGLVTVKSTNPMDLKEDHQVLAYGYDLGGDGGLSLRLYDPNQPGRDDVTLSLAVDHPTQPTTVTMLPAGPTVYSFFRVAYTPAVPP
jgi:hypothetical protein